MKENDIKNCLNFYYSILLTNLLIKHSFKSFQFLIFNEIIKILNSHVKKNQLYHNLIRFVWRFHRFGARRSLAPL